jgi:DNA-binding transcriptional regulator YbjK
MKTTNALILEGTLEVIVRGGVTAVTFREVAKECGVPLGTISYQYPKREELVRSAFAHFLSEMTVSLRTLVQSMDVRTSEDLARLMTEATRASFADPRRMYLAEYELVVYAARDPAIAEALAEWDRTLIAELGQIVERVGLPAPFSTAQSLCELSRGFEVVAMSQPEPDFEAYRQRVLRLLAGLQPERALPDKRAPKSPVRRARGPR